MTTPTVSEHDLMVAAYHEARQRRGEPPNPVEFQYFQASDDYQEDEDDKEVQRFVCVDKGVFKAALSTNPLVYTPAAMLISRKYYRGPECSGWYVQAHDETGSRTWYYRGKTVQDVINFYQEL